MVAVPSIVDEMGPLVVLEAMAYAKPVVAFDIGGQRELITAAQSGVLITPFDVTGFAQSMVDLYRNKDRAHHLGNNGLEYVLRHATNEQHLTALLDQYHQVLGGA